MAATVAGDALPPRVVFSFDPMLPVLKRIATAGDFTGTFKKAAYCFDSSAFLDVSFVSLKNLPIIYFGNRPIVQSFDTKISSHMRYVESVVHSLASTVFNFAMGVVFSVAAGATLGQFDAINDQMKKHWVHTALAIGAVAVGIVGAVSPEWGIKANLALGAGILVGLYQWMQGDLAGKVCSVYQRHGREFKEAAQRGVQSAEGLRQLDALFGYLDANLNTRNVKSLGNLMEVIGEARERMPSFSPTVSPNLALRTFLGIELAN